MTDNPADRHVPVDAAGAVDTIDPIRYFIADADRTEVTNDVTLLALAGAKLAYAIYHSGAAFVRSMPDSVTKAYAHACTAFDLGGHRVPSDVEPVSPRPNGEPT